MQDDGLEVPNQAIMERVSEALVGMNMRGTIVACLSLAATTANLIGMPKMELQKMLIRFYDKRIAEAQANAH